MIFGGKILIPILLLFGSTSPAKNKMTGDSICLNEVTVTAIKQSSNLRTQATALSEFSRVDIERNALTSVKMAADLVPNFFIPDYGSRMTGTIYVRGLGTRIDQPAVGLNIDNVPILCKENYDFELMDIAKIEMLRGPQSTLYGRNTMGGVMNIYTLSPLNYQGSKLVLEYGTRNSYKLGAGTYRKFKSNLGLSAGIFHSSTDGEFLNQYNSKKTDWEQLTSGRVKLDWLADSTLMVNNNLSFSTTRQGGYPYEYVKTGVISHDDTCFYRRTSILAGLTLKKKFTKFTLSGITGYQYIDDNMTLDQDFTPEPYFTLTQARKEHGVTEDLVARYRKNNYECLTGLFGFFRHYNMKAPVTFKDAGIANLIEAHVNEAIPAYPVVWNSRSFLLDSEFKSDNWGIALYHQSTYDWKKFTFQVGLRFDYENAMLNYHSETHTGYSIVERATGKVFAREAININERGRLSKSFTQLLPKFTITYRLRGRRWETIYVSVTKGCKAGGFNTQMFSDVLQQKLMGIMGIGASYNINQIVSYKPEKAWNFEFGGHFETWTAHDGHRRVKSDVSVFYMDCTDRQLTIFPDGTTTGRVMTNAGKTRSWGLEIATNITPWEGTGINLSYGYTNAKFVKYNNGKTDFKGNFVPYSPMHTVFGELFHVFELNKSGRWFKRLTLDANVKAAGKIYWNEANSLSQPFYALLGASARLEGARYSLEMWARNLTGTNYNTFYFVSIGHEFLQRAHGRTMGMTLKVNI